MEVGLVGRGQRFEALAHLLRNHQVYHWAADGDDEALELADHVRQVDVGALKDTPIIFLCLPIHRLRSTGRELGGVLSGRHVLVHTTRSLEHATLKSPSTILGEETPTRRFGFLTGPFDAADVLAKRPSSGVCASEFVEVHDLCEDVLDVDDFRVYRAQDIEGAEAAAAYTRIIAMLAGIAHHMALGASLEATLFTRGLAETSRFVVYRGGFEKTAFGLSGCGNLHRDTGADASVDVEIGQEFMRRDGVDPETLRAEFGGPANGLFNLIDSLQTVSEGSGVDLPILEHALELIDGRSSAQQVLKALLALPVYHE
jgi:glycerol-3-phosphate dehydrogenase (NAD(P)+)